MKPAVLSEEAEIEAVEASRFYTERSARLAEDFTSEMNRVLAVLENHPKIGAPMRHGLHRVLLRRFPYSLLYRVEEAQVLVLAVAHQSRRPGYWLDRI